MSTVNNNVDASVAALGMANAQSKNLMADTQDRFLTLLVTQLRNQDPLNPMDNAQVTSQIAQMSTVNGITQLNNTLMAVAGQMDVTQSMQAAGLIGKEVLVPGSKVLLGSDAEGQKVATPFGIDLAELEHHDQGPDPGQQRQGGARVRQGRPEGRRLFHGMGRT